MLKRSILLAACFAAAFLFAAGPRPDATAIGRTRNGFPLIVPQPKQLKALSGTFALPAGFTVAAPKELDLAPLITVYRQTVKGGEVVPAGKAVCRFEIVSDGVPKSPEGYTLAVSGSGIDVKARDVRGLYCGMQTLGWILRNRTAPDALPNCAITDWPDLELRGLFLQLPPVEPSRLDRICHVIDTLGTLKYNTLLISFYDNFPFSDAPFTKRKTTFSRADIAKIVAAAKRNHMEIIPKLQVLSHAAWMRTHRDWPKFDEGPVKKPHYTTYCLSNPDVQPVVEQVVRETADLLKPRYFHLGLDEILLCGFPKCPKCKAANLTELIVNHVKPIKKILDDRGITAIVYQDDFFGSDNPGSPAVSPIATVPEKLGKDLMINSWEYGSDPTPAVGSKIRKRGFEKLLYMSFAINPDNCQNLPKLAHAVKAKGNILAYWSMVPVTLDRHDGGNNFFYASTVEQGNYCWNAGDIEFSRIPIDSANILRELLDGKPARRFRGKAAPVAVSGVCNTALSERGSLLPRFDAALTEKVKRIAAADPAKFELAAVDGVLGAVVLSGTPTDTFPRQPVTIPVGRKATGASFLTTSAIYNTCCITSDHAAITIGELKVVYDDGKSAEIPLSFRRNINDWNLYIAGNACRSVVRGNDLDGAIFNFTAIDWRNPRPETPIREIVFSSQGKSMISPVLLAVSLSDADGNPAGAPGAPRLDAGAGRCTAPSRRIPVVDFRNGLPKRSKPDKTAVPGYKCKVVDDPECGKVLEFTIPTTTRRLARVWVDLPIRKPQEFKNVLFKIKVSNPAAIYRADFYVMDWSASHVLDVLGYTKGFTAGRWQTICLPRGRFEKKAGGGIDPAKAECVRVGFFLHDGVKPTTVRVSNIDFCDQVLPARINLAIPAK